MENNYTPSSYSAMMYRKNLAANLSIAFSFLVMAFLAIGVGFLDISALILTIPFLFIPALFGFQTYLRGINNKQPLSFQLSFRYAFAYFRRPFFGSYRLLISALKTFGIYFLISLLVTMIALPLSQAINPEITNELSTILSAYESATTAEQIYQAVYSCPNFYQMISICSVINVFFALAFFLHCLGIGSFCVRVKDDSPMGNQTFLGCFRLIRKEFYKEYIKFAWPILPLAALGYALGAVLASIWSSYPSDWIIAGFLGVLVFVTFYLPYYFHALSYLTQTLNPKIRGEALKRAEEMLEAMKATSRVDAETIREMEESLAKAKEEQEKEGEQKDEEK